MCNIRHRVIMLLVFLLSFTSAQGASPPVSPIKQFVTEYPSGQARLRSFYANMRIRGTERAIRYGEDPSKGVTTIQEWEFCGNENLQRAVAVFPEQSADYAAGTSFALVAAPDLSFRLKRSSASSRYSIISMESVSPKDYHSLVGGIRERAKAAAAAYCIFGTPIQDFAKERSFKVVRAHEIEAPDAKLVKVEWENSPSDVLHRDGFFTFAPDSCWALREYEFHLRVKDEKTGKRSDFGRYGILEYSGEQAGVPLLHKFQTWTSGPAGKFPESVVEVDQLIPGPVPKSEFTLEAFGLHNGPPPPSIPIVYYLLALALLTATLAGVLRYLQHRSVSSRRVV